MLLMLRSFVTAQRPFSRPVALPKALTRDSVPSSILRRWPCQYERNTGVKKGTYHFTLCPRFSRSVLTVVQEKRTSLGKPNVGSKESLSQACVLGSILATARSATNVLALNIGMTNH